MKISHSLFHLTFALILSTTVSAASVVLVPDEALVEQAEVIVRGSVQSVGPAPVPGYTDYIVTTEKVLKGSAGPTVTVRIIGGEANGLSMRIIGAPRLALGEEALLFLRHTDGLIHRPMHLMLGVFHLSGHEEHGHAFRDLSETAVVQLEGVDTADESLLRDRAAFERWIEARVAGDSPTPDYRRIPSPYQAIWEPFTLFVSGSGNNMRWFAFDEGQTVPWVIDPPEFTGTSPAAAQLQNAVSAWNRAPGAFIRYAVSGETTATAGLTNYDEINAVIFGDPNGEVDDTFSCSSGGVLAIGGPWFGSSTVPFRDRQVHRTVGADIVFNDGVECISQTPTALRDFEEVMGHELGHTLGFGHSCGDDASGTCEVGTPQNSALMRAFAQLDGRGAVLNSDDLAAAAELYPDLATTPNHGRRRSVTRP